MSLDVRMLTLACLLLAACGEPRAAAGFTVDASVDATVPDADLTETSMPSLLGTQSDASPCVGLECQQGGCPAGSETTLTGTVYAPNGTMPLYNVVVYVPNAPVMPLTKGVQCDQCGAPASGDPIATALSNAKGEFVLKNVPSGKNIPLVVQLGKWRRQTTIASVPACSVTHISDPNLTRLPKNQTEGNMPHIALTTGDCDSLGCMLPKVGIDPAEFGYESDGYAKAVNVYNAYSEGTVTPLPAATPATNLWNRLPTLKTYDMAIFSCECEEGPDQSAPSYQAVTSYLAEGGRIFTTDFQYTWYKYSPDANLSGIGTIPGGAPSGGTPFNLDTNFPKGLALADWLELVYPTGTYAEITPDSAFANVTSLTNTPETWASSPGVPGVGATGPRVFTVNTPVGKPVSGQCGKGVHIDAHVNEPGTGGTDYVGCGLGGVMGACYPSTCMSPLKEAEAMFAFFFFDLASCIQNEGQPPQPPAPQ
jgi:hypothetical protein